MALHHRDDSVADITGRVEEHFQKTIVCKHSSSLHPKMQAETLPCDEETVYEPDPETLSPSVGLSSFKMD